MNRWLAGLQLADDDDGYLDHYRWPRTPVGNLQAEIWRRVGASDWNVLHPDCRAWNIMDTLNQLVTNKLLHKRFTVLDICCGDGVVLDQLTNLHASPRCFGVDLLHYPQHEDAYRNGVAFYRVPLQRLVESEPPGVIDVGIMLNTFRGWDRADLAPEEESDLPARTLHWLKGFCRFAFLTVTMEQVDWLKHDGWFVWDVGKGEDNSRLVCAFPCEGPEGPRGVWSLT